MAKVGSTHHSPFIVTRIFWMFLFGGKLGIFEGNISSRHCFSRETPKDFSSVLEGDLFLCFLLQVVVLTTILLVLETVINSPSAIYFLGIVTQYFSIWFSDDPLLNLTLPVTKLFSELLSHCKARGNLRGTGLIRALSSRILYLSRVAPRGWLPTLIYLILFSSIENWLGKLGCHSLIFTKSHVFFENGPFSSTNGIVGWVFFFLVKFYFFLLLRNVMNELIRCCRLR